MVGGHPSLAGMLTSSVAWNARTMSERQQGQRRESKGWLEFGDMDLAVGRGRGPLPLRTILLPPLPSLRWRQGKEQRQIEASDGYQEAWATRGPRWEHCGRLASFSRRRFTTSSASNLCLGRRGLQRRIAPRRQQRAQPTATVEGWNRVYIYI